MTEPANLQVQIGLPDQFKSAAARLFYDAFGHKLRPIVGEEKSGVAIIQDGISAAHCVCAYSGDQLIGIAGFRHMRQQFVYVRRSALIREFGLASGLVRFVLFAVTNRLPKPRELMMDGIAVQSLSRGRGVGTQMFDTLQHFARQQGYCSIRLDVIDTNPNARRLYERVGFVARETRQYPFLTSLGFTAVTTMIREVR